MMTTAARAHTPGLRRNTHAMAGSHSRHRHRKACGRVPTAGGDGSRQGGGDRHGGDQPECAHRTTYQFLSNQLPASTSPIERSAVANSSISGSDAPA